MCVKRRVLSVVHAPKMCFLSGVKVDSLASGIWNKKSIDNLWIDTCTIYPVHAEIAELARGQTTYIELQETDSEGWVLT